MWANRRLSTATVAAAHNPVSGRTHVTTTKDVLYVKARAVAVTVALALLGFAGCSGSGDSASNENLPDPCTLWATTDLDAITGAVWTQQPPPEAGGPICDWTSAAPPGLTKAFVAADTGDSFDSNRASISNAGVEPTEIEIEGADKAFTTADGGLVGMKVGDWYVQVDFATQPPAAAPGSVTQQLATKAAAQLKATG